MKETVLQLLNQLLPDLLYILALVVIFYARGLIKTMLPKATAWMEAHTTATQRKNISDLGHEAFVYAETVFRERNGADKLMEALKYFNSHMSKYGLDNLTFDTIRAAVEKAWLADKSMNNSGVQMTAEPIALTSDTQPATQSQATT